MRTIDTEHNWFWQQGFHDGLDGLRAVAPDETRYSFQRSDYFIGYEAGQEDRAIAQEQAMVDAWDPDSDAVIIGLL